MVRLVGLAALLMPVLGARLEVSEGEAALEAHAATVTRGLELKEQLKENPDDVNLQKEYGELIGGVEFHESRVFLETGAHVNESQQPLGEQSSPGHVLTMAERTGVVESIGRLLTKRRDYVFENDGGNLRYIMDGRSLSLHSRMFATVVGEPNPRYIVRRAFNYYNLVSRAFGQYVYRVIQCQDVHWGECSEGDILYTITKDRLGRGALWGRDEYRVYTGTGGCSRHGYGIVGCAQESQIMYSLGSGLTDASYDTDIYRGNIVQTHGDHSITVRTGGGDSVRVREDELNRMKVAHTTQVAGPPRALQWVSLFHPLVAYGLILSSELIWTDSYRVHFDAAADEMLVCFMVAIQDMTRDLSVHGIN